MIAGQGVAVAYWVYENWTSEQKAIVHAGNCGYCNDGRGRTPNRQGEKNGRWHGPFPTLEEANQAAQATGRPVRQDRCVMPVRERSCSDHSTDG